LYQESEEEDLEEDKMELKEEKDNDKPKFFVIENERKKDEYRVISKKSMDDTDLLVSIHNSIVKYKQLI